MRKTRSRKISMALLALVMSLSLAACQGSGVGVQETVQESSVDAGSQEAETPAESKEQATPAPEATPEPTPEPEETGYKIADFELPDTETYRMLYDMKIGWNLGNTFDAMDCDQWISDEMQYESAWCQAMTTPELIAELKNAGFNTIRIPVSWHNHLTDKTKYTISEQWLARVNEVVDYCMDQDMYVILNIHHDNSKEFFYPSSEYLDQSVKYITAIWTQLSDRFRDYDEKLLFASMNEPRLVGHTNEWWINAASEDCRDAISCINTLNQTFVDVVRASGGNNASRYLVCPGYDASVDGALNSGYVLPTDPVDNDQRIIISVHAYTPYNFALESPGTDTWTSKKASDISNMVSFMNDLYRTYVSKGIPVIIDEFGAQEKKGNIEARTDFAGCYVANARARGLTCIWWDNNVMSGTGERFGLIDRKSLKWIFPEIVEAMMEYAQ